MRFYLVVLLTMASRAECQSSGRRSRPDSAHALLSRRDLMMFAGAALATTAAMPLDRTVQRAMLAGDVHDDRRLRAAANDFAFLGGPGPFVGGAALYLVGWTTGSSRVATLGADLTDGVVLAAGLNGLVKGLAGRQLPNATATDPGDFSFGRGFHDNNGSFVSFPSGHTAASFAAATVIADAAYDWSPSAAHVIEPAAYTLATVIAVSRLYQNVHWASDLPLGAAIGIWSGRTAVAWQRQHADDWLSRRLPGFMIAPSPHGLAITETLTMPR